MTTAIVAGLVVGVGVWLAWSGLHPLPEPLGAVLARVEGLGTGGRVGAEASVDRDTRVGRFLLQRLPVLDRAVGQVATDLRIVGRSPEEHAARIGSYVLASLVVGPWVGFVAWVVGAPVPAFIPAGIALGGVAWGVVMPFLHLRQQAQYRRTAFAHALSAWCDVVVMGLAAGRGVEQAMETAVSAGQGWAFAELRGALRAGYVRAETPWEALEQLGVELGVADLTELASTIAMAGEEGAAVRLTVAAKARTIRERITSDTEMKAAAATERMSLPTVLVVMGFLVFLGFPAVTVLFQL
jgi:tight adherence protein C